MSFAGEKCPYEIFVRLSPPSWFWEKENRHHLSKLTNYWSTHTAKAGGIYRKSGHTSDGRPKYVKGDYVLSHSKTNSPGLWNIALKGEDKEEGLLRSARIKAECPTSKYSSILIKTTP